MSRRQNSLMKFSRTERLAQLSEQEIVIEKKKKEILARLEAQKRKLSEEAFRKSEPTKEINSDNSKSSKNSLQNRVECQRGEEDKEKLGDKTKSERLTNAFSNDGTFLDQFKKLTKTNTQQNNSEMESLKSRDENLKRRINSEAIKDAYKSSGVKSQSSFLRKPVDSSTRLPFSPPGTDQVTTKQASGASPLNQNSPSQVLPNSAQTPFSEDATHSVKLNSSSKQVPLDSGPGLEEKNIGGVLPSFSNLVSAFSYSKPSQNIPFTHKKLELPKVRSESISMTLKSNSVKRLEAIPNPLGVEDEAVSPPTKKPQFVFSKKKETCKEGDGNFLKNSDSELPISCTFPHEDSSSVSSALTKGGEFDESKYSEEALHKWAKLVAQYGDDFEDILQQRSDAELRFLREKESNVYQTYRKHVLKYRSNFNPLSRETSEKGSVNFLTTNSPKPERELADDEINFSRRRSADLSDSRESLVLGSESVSKDTSRSLIINEGTLTYSKTPKSELEKACFSPYQQETQNKNTGESAANTSDRADERRKRKRKSRWGDVVTRPSTSAAETNTILQPLGKMPKSTLLSQLTRSDPGLIQYAKQTFGSTNLSEEDWKKAEDHYKINLLYQDMVKKRAEVEKLERQGKFKYEYDSDEDTEGGTWEHKLRQQEMQATQLWAEELTRQAAGKHHIGDFLPPEELERFMEKYNAVKQGREPDLSDYKEFKLKEDNVGYRLLQKMGWNEGQGLGQDGSGITNPVNKAIVRHENQGLGVERPDGLEPGDDEYDAYRKRMMLAYRFRPNPLNNPRRPYY